MRWLKNALLDEEKNDANHNIPNNYTVLTCSALSYEQRFTIYGEIMT